MHEDEADEAYVVFNSYSSEGRVFQEHPRTTAELETVLSRDLKEASPGTIIILRGHQPAKVLNLIGAKFSVDPEFFRRHLDFGKRSTHTESFSDSFLPSSTTNIIRLATTTIGFRSAQPGVSLRANHENLQELRDQSSKLIGQYLNKVSLARASDVRQGDSVVRDFSLHDRQFFSIEQYMSVYVHVEKPTWLGKHFLLEARPSCTGSG